MFQVKKEEEVPITLSTTPHLIILRGTGYTKEGLAFLNKLRTSRFTNLSYIRADDVLHEEFNRDVSKYVLGMRERSHSALKRGDHSIVEGAINSDDGEYHGPSLTSFLVGDALNERKVPALQFCFDEPFQTFLERQRERSRINGWNYSDANFNRWYAATRPTKSDIIIPVTSVEETVNTLWRHMPL